MSIEARRMHVRQGRMQPGSPDMPTLLRKMKFQAIFALAAVFLLALPSIADAQSAGTVRFRVAKAGFIFGVGGGSGVLNFKGRTYPLRVDGLSAGTIGVAE